MKVKFYGTRGSVPISNKKSVKYGGNTTCLRVISECVPPEMVLAVDAGTGFVPLSFDVLKENGLKEVVVLFTHFHHDHTQGVFLSPILFMKNIRLNLWGPVEAGVGPKEMMGTLMRSPFFPVDFREVSSHINCKNLEFPKTNVILFHPKGGKKIMMVDAYERLVSANKHLPIGKGKYPVEECLVVTMYKSRHPEYTIAYRFEEKPTEKTFVFLSDHENEAGIPQALKVHLKDVSLLVMDSQYTRSVYEERTAGYGHGTPDYCVLIGRESSAKKLGLTHHDPASTDGDIETILAQAEKENQDGKMQIFTCYDYQEVEV